MADHDSDLRHHLDDVRQRRRRLLTRRAWTVGAAAAAVCLGTAAIAAWLVRPEGWALVGLTILAVLAATGLGVRAWWPTRRRPSDLQIARLVEERSGGLDDVVATAVEYAGRPEHDRAMAALLAGDATR